ncbi:MAG: phenylacetate--CoA ligase, partial [Armatimonadota bacterium]|nr:phenylacetate--CoA ligase [Armatimonadota bacterium]
MIWDPERECADRVSLVQVQLERLRAVLARLAARVPFYRQRLAAALIDADGITALEDLRRLPLTTKDDLRRLYPFGLFA